MQDGARTIMVLDAGPFVRGAKEAERAAGGVDDELRRLHARIKAAEDALGAGGAQSKDFARQLGALRGSVDELRDSTDRNTDALREQMEAMERGERAANQYAAAGKAVHEAWGAAREVLRAGAAALGTFAAREDAMIGLAKTTNLTASELARLEEHFVALSTMEDAVPVKTEELIDLAAAAGQLGVEGAENLALYAEVIAELAASTDLVGPEAAMILTRIMSVQGEGPENVEKLASSLVLLGNTSAATEREIAKVANRVALSTAQFRIGSIDVAGMSAALAESGIRAQLGGSQIGRAMQLIGDAVATGGDKLDRLAEVARVSSDTLVDAWAADKTGALITVLRGMAQEGENLGPVLAEIGLGGLQAASVFPTLTANVDRFADRVAAARGEAENMTALSAESAAAFSTFGSSVTRAQNAIRQVGVVIGSELAPVIADLIDRLIEVGAENEGLIRSLGRDLAAAVSGAGEVLVFLAENMDAVVTVAKTLVAVKLAQWVSGVASAIPPALAGLREWSSASASAATGTEAFLRVGLTPLAIGLAGVLAATIAAADGIRKWRDELAAGIQAEVEGAAAFADSLKAIRSESGRLLDAATQEAEAMAAIRRAAVDPAGAQAEAIRQQTALKFHAERLDLLAKQRKALGDARAEEGEYREQLDRTTAALERWGEELAASHHVETAGRARARIDELEASQEALQRSAREAATRVRALESSTAALADATRDVVIPTRQAVAAVVDLGKGTQATTQATRSTSKELASSAKAMKAHAAAAESAAKATGKDLDRALDEVADTLKKTLGPELTAGQRAVEDWQDSLADAATAIREERSAIEDAAAAQIAAADAASRAASSEAERAVIASELEGNLLALLMRSLELAAAEAKLAQARAESAGVEARLTAADRARIAELETEIAAIHRYADAVEMGSDAVAELEIAERRAETRSRAFGEAVEATGGDLDKAAELADQYVAALDRVAAAEEEAAAKADRLDRVTDALGSIAGMLASIETGSDDANAALGAFGAGMQGFLAARREGATTGEQVSTGVGTGFSAWALSQNRSGTTSQFGGRRGGTYAREGAQIGSTFGPIGTFVGMVLGGLIQFSGDRAVVAMEEAERGVRARIVQAEGGLKDVANTISETLGGFFERVGILTGAAINATLGGLQVSIEDDIVTVNVAGLTAGFRDLSEALAWGAEHVLRMNAEAAGIGENVRRMFESLGKPIAEAGIEELARGLEIAQMMDDLATGRVPELAQAWRTLRSEMAEDARVADLYNLSMVGVVEIHRQRLAQATAEIEQQRAMLFGARDVTAGYLALIDAEREQAIAMGDEAAAGWARVAEIEALIAAEEAAAEAAATTAAGVTATTSAISSVAAGMVQAGRQFDAGGGKLLGKMGGLTDGVGTLTGAVTEAGLEALERVRDFGQLREELAALRDHLADLPAAFSAADIAQAARVAGASAGEALVQMVQQVQGAQFGAEQQRLFATIRYSAALQEQIALTEAFLASVDALDEGVRRALLRTIAAAEATLADVLAGRIAPPGAGAADRAQRRRERDEIIAELQAVSEAFAGVSPDLRQFRADLAAIGETADRAAGLGVAADRVRQFVDEALRLEEVDFLAPFRERLLGAGETAAETARRQIEEARAEALAQAQALAEAQAAAGMGTVEEIFARLAETIHAAIDLDLLEAEARAAEEAERAERDRIGALEDLAEAEAQSAESLRDLRAALTEQQDIAAATAPAIVALREIEDRFAAMTADAMALMSGTAELDDHLRQLAEAEAGVVDRQAIEALGDIGGFLQQAGAALDPEQAELYARAMFETTRVQALAVLSQERYRDSLAAAGVDLEHWIRTLEELEFPGAEPTTRPEGRIWRMPGMGAPGGPAPSTIDELARLRDAMARVAAGWNQVSDPVLRALAAVTEQVDDFRQKVIAAGGSVADLADLEAAAAAERAEILRTHFAQLEDRLREIALGDIRQAPIERLRGMFGELEDVAAAVRGGEIGRLREALDLERAIRAMISDVADPAVGIGAVMGDQLTAILESLRLAQPGADGLLGPLDTVADGEQAAIQAALAGVIDSVDASGAISRQLLDAQIRQVEQGQVMIGVMQQIAAAQVAQLARLGDASASMAAMVDRSNRIAISTAATATGVAGLQVAAASGLGLSAQANVYLGQIAAIPPTLPPPGVV